MSRVILIYQPGKVASKSMFQAIKKVSNDDNIYHIHHLAPKQIKKFEKLEAKLYHDKTGHLMESKKVLKLIEFFYSK